MFGFKYITLGLNTYSLFPVFFVTYILFSLFLPYNVTNKEPQKKGFNFSKFKLLKVENISR